MALYWQYSCSEKKPKDAKHKNNHSLFFNLKVYKVKSQLILKESLLRRDNLKKLLTTVILVTLVLSAFAALSTPRVGASAGDVAILSYSWHTALNTVLAEYSGDLAAVGEVQNTGTTTIGSVFIYGVAYNATGQALCTANAPVQAVPDILLGRKHRSTWILLLRTA